MSDSNIFNFEADYDLEEDFPNLRTRGWQKKSERDTKYNCVAYAANDLRRKWDSARGYYWPPGAVREYSIAGWADAFRVLGYKPCESIEPEPDFEKIAIYEKNGKPTHVARQRESGVWTSKLGPDEDIDHNTLDALEGEIYGRPSFFMKRRRWTPKAENEPMLISNT